MYDLRVKAYAAAVQAVRDERKTLSLAEATDVVTSVLTGWGVHQRRRDSERMARAVLDPHWPLKHPFKAYREGWRFRTKDN
jgi:hypothetical protein